MEQIITHTITKLLTQPLIHIPNWTLCVLVLQNCVQNPYKARCDCSFVLFFSFFSFQNILPCIFTLPDVLSMRWSLVCGISGLLWLNWHFWLEIKLERKGFLIGFAVDLGHLILGLSSNRNIFKEWKTICLISDFCCILYCHPDCFRPASVNTAAVSRPRTAS